MSYAQVSPAQQMNQLAQELAEPVPRRGDWRTCPICGGAIYFNRLVSHLEAEHRDELIFQIQSKGANAK